jgi:hypothetical protein
MELFLPSIALLLVASLIVFLVLPRIGAPILAVLSLTLLIFGVYNHYYLFYSEYRFSTWQERLKFYGPFIIIGALILAIISYMGFLFGTQGANALPASNLPANISPVSVATDTTNAVANTAANAATAATNAVTNAVNTTLNAVGLGGPKNNKGILTNLGNILATPNAKRNNRLF